MSAFFFFGRHYVWYNWFIKKEADICEKKGDFFL